MNNDFMNKPVPGEINKEMVEKTLESCDYIFRLALDGSISKNYMTVSDLNYLIHIHMENLIRRYDLEYSDFKKYISIWEILMKEKEKERKELWD